MALIWTKQVKNTQYELRQSGASLRLYTNGVFHSQYNERFPFSGGVWDLLLLPALMKPVNSIQRVLVLGVGAGAIVRLLQKFVAPQLIIGIDLDRVHLYVAKRWLQVNRHGRVDLHCVNAVDWLKSYRGPKFDMIVEDLFAEEQGEPVRAVTADSAWCQALFDVLSDNGVLAMNFDMRSTLNASALRQDSNVKKRFAKAYVMQVPGYDNRVGAFMTGEGDTFQLKTNMYRLRTEFGAGLTRRLKAKITALT